LDYMGYFVREEKTFPLAIKTRQSQAIGAGQAVEQTLHVCFSPLHLPTSPPCVKREAGTAGCHSLMGEDARGAEVRQIVGPFIHFQVKLDCLVQSVLVGHLPALLWSRFGWCDNFPKN
jgi:hypothetical protein